MAEQDLKDAVIEQIEEDILNGDYSAINVLLDNCIIEALENFLSEAK